MSLCLAAGALTAVIAADAFMLAWTHSIEKIRWEEDWRVENGRLGIVAARIRGSGAGMEIPDGAILRNGTWHYQPAIRPIEQLALVHSAHAADHELCVGSECHSLADYLPGLATPAVVNIVACERQ